MDRPMSREEHIEQQVDEPEGTDTQAQHAANGSTSAVVETTGSARTTPAARETAKAAEQSSAETPDAVDNEPSNEDENNKIVSLETIRRTSNSSPASPADAESAGVANDDEAPEPSLEDEVARLSRELSGMDDVVREFADMLGEARAERARVERLASGLELQVDSQKQEISKLELQVWQQTEILDRNTRIQARAAQLLKGWQRHTAQLEAFAAQNEIALGRRVEELENQLAESEARCTLAEQRAAETREIAEELLDTRWMRRWRKEAYRGRLDSAGSD